MWTYRRMILECNRHILIVKKNVVERIPPSYSSHLIYTCIFQKESFMKIFALHRRHRAMMTMIPSKTNDWGSASFSRHPETINSQIIID